MNNRFLRWVTVVIPVTFVLGLILFIKLYWDFEVSWIEVAILLVMIGIATAVFSTWVFDIVGQREDEIKRRASQLEALNQAAIALNTQLDLAIVLEKVVDLARQLTGAQYGALGVLDQEGVQFGQFIASGLTDDEERAIGMPPKGHGVFSVLLEDRTSLRVADIQRHERAIGFPRNHPPMHAMIGVPIVSKGKVIGDLYVANKLHGGSERGLTEPLEFTDEDLQLIEMFSVQAALAIENARLYRQTQELAILEERERFGMDLHDGTIQSIYAVGLMMEDIKRRIDDEPDISKERIGEAVESLNGVIADIRNYILDLRPQQFEGRNIVQGIDEIARALRANTFLSVDVDVARIEPSVIDAETTVEVLHVMQEAVSNISKHAHAREVNITGYQRDGRVYLEILDDGISITPEVVEKPTGNGLNNMRDRLRGLRGSFAIAPRADGGTSIQLDFPLKK